MAKHDRSKIKVGSRIKRNRDGKIGTVISFSPATKERCEGCLVKWPSGTSSISVHTIATDGREYKSNNSLIIEENVPEVDSTDAPQTVKEPIAGRCVYSVEYNGGIYGSPNDWCVRVKRASVPSIGFPALDKTLFLVNSEQAGKVIADLLNAERAIVVDL
jgi:hypothetical protein